MGGVTTAYLVDTNNPTGYAQVAEELQGGAVLRQYTYGPDLISQRQLINGQWSLSYYGYDGHGSVRSLTDSAGSITDTYVYDAFGALISRTGSTPNEYLYAGERFDAETGMYYLRARYMSPASGRFLSMDEFQGSAFDPASLHKYLYVNGSPVNGADPSGQFGDFSISGLLTSMAISAVLNGIVTAATGGTIREVAVSMGIGALEGAAFYVATLGALKLLLRTARAIKTARAVAAVTRILSKVESTEPLWPGTEIPIRFTLITRVGKFFISGGERLAADGVSEATGATKHIVNELIPKLMERAGVNSRVASGIILTDLEAAIVDASANGIRYGEKMVVGNWELIFEQPTTAGYLPKLYHAVRMGLSDLIP